MRLRTMVGLACWAACWGTLGPLQEAAAHPLVPQDSAEYDKPSETTYPLRPFVGCQTAACEKRVKIKAIHAKWRAVVNAYPAGVLAARARCESGGHGTYSLSTTTGVFWFAFQFEPRAWYGAGGRMRRGIPAGVWTRQPSRLEQQYRAIRWERIHGGDPWPNC